jgi:hypothetical protein
MAVRGEVVDGDGLPVYIAQVEQALEESAKSRRPRRSWIERKEAEPREACAASGHATADPAIPAMKWRRRIAQPQVRNRLIPAFNSSPSKQEFATRGMRRNAQFALHHFFCCT